MNGRLLVGTGQKLLVGTGESGLVPPLEELVDSQKETLRLGRCHWDHPPFGGGWESR